MRKYRFLGTFLVTIFIYFICSVHMPTALAAENQTSSYIILNMGGSSQQKIYVYNHGRLETQILQDNSMIQYTYDRNGNLLKKSTAYSAEPYVFSTSAVSYDIYLKGVPDSVKLVRFPTWTEQDGQDDIDWIVGEKVAPGLWKGMIIFSKHGGVGTYITHVYSDQSAVGGVSAQVKDTVKVTSPQTASLADGFYEVSVEDVAQTVSEVRFPSWTDTGGQDDLVNPWIVGEKVNDTTWRIRVPFSEHNFETGNYNTHIYAFDRYGNSRGLGDTRISVSGGAGGSTETDISGVSYDVFIYGVDAQVQKVQFPTWTANAGQDDIEWIEGIKVANGVWKGTVVYEKHGSEIGRYITHIYADGKYNGMWEFDVTNAVIVDAPTVVYTTNGFYDITISGVPSSITNVKFPTWTESNGHDDIIWTAGERLNQTSWRIRIPFYQHNNETGTYITHIYAYDSYGNSRIIGALSVQAKK